MNVKKIKRKCMVKGCKNKDTYTISKSRDFGNTVLICQSCLQEALELITPPKSPTLAELLLDEGFKQQIREAIEEGVKEGLELAKKDNDVPDGVTDPDAENSTAVDNEETPNDQTSEQTDGEETSPEQINAAGKEFVCGKCGKVCASQSGLTKHEKACDAK